MSFGKEGAEYEKKINTILMKNKLQPPSFRHQPYNNDHPDSVFLKNGRQYGIEVKHIYRTSFGSYGVSHDGKKWILSPPQVGNTEMYNMLKTARVEQEINRFYRGMGIPYLFTQSKLTTEQRLSDVKTFGNKTTTIRINSDAASKYYTSKGVNYMQIQNLGFYYLVNNPAKIECPRLVISGMQGELRLKKEIKGGIQYYRFVIQIKPIGTLPQKSKVNIDLSIDFLK